jgi:hypothetical protein
MKTFVSTWKKMNKPGFGPGFSKTLLLLFVMVSLLNAGCRKDIQEPKHKNKGKNVIYLKIDEQEFLIKEGFSLNRNVIRADIVGQGVKRSEKPIFQENEYFGKKYIFLSINHEKKTNTDYLGRAFWDISFYENGELGTGIPNGIMLNFFSEKHKKWITFNTNGYGLPGQFFPQVTMLHHSPQNQTLSAIYETRYFDSLDSNLTGNLYMYFDIEYEKL